MSEGERIPLEAARQLAEEVVDLLRPLAQRIEIAGSIRRGKETVGDMEIVVQVAGMDGTPLDALIERLRETSVIVPRKRQTDDKPEAWSTRHKRGWYKGVKLDLFIVRPDRSWGLTYLLRTGPGDANTYLVTRRISDNNDFGGCPPHLIMREGTLYRLPFPWQGEAKPKELLQAGAVPLDLPEESDVFAALGMPYIEPAERTVDRYRAEWRSAVPPLVLPSAGVTVYTGRISLRDPDVLDITVGAIEDDRAEPHGIALSPLRTMVNRHKSGAISDEQYTKEYLELLRWRYQWYPQVFIDILSRGRVVLACYCAEGKFCHRHLAVDVLRKIADQHKIPFTYEGELLPPEPPAPESQPENGTLFDVPSQLDTAPPAPIDTEAVNAYLDYEARIWAACYPKTTAAQWRAYFADPRPLNEKMELRPVPMHTAMSRPVAKRSGGSLRYPDDGVLISEHNGVMTVRETLYGVTAVRSTPLAEISRHIKPEPEIEAQVLSLWQAWAQFLVIGVKQFETRHWSTNYRGWLVIHAAKKWDRENRYSAYDEPFASILRGHDCDPAKLAFGAAVGAVKLVNVLKAEHVRASVTKRELLLGDWSAGRYVWQMEKPILFKKPIPMVGKQGLWKWDNSVCSLRELLRGAA